MAYDLELERTRPYAISHTPISLAFEILLSRLKAD
jgi:hypothetical protein